MRRQKSIKPWFVQFGWLVVLWIASVASLAIVAGAIRLLLAAAGMRTH